MKQHARTNHSAQRRIAAQRLGVTCGLSFAIATACLAWFAPPSPTPPLRSPAPPAPTFSRDVAPIIFSNCSGCHRPDQSAPFSLLTFADVRKHAPNIARLTADRAMPPWLPEPGHGTFANDRRMKDADIDRIRRWVAAGTPEGNPSELPSAPHFVDGWQLGQPDLVLRLPEPFLLPAEGRDTYRNFVIPTSFTSTRYVRGLEFRPLNPTIVHHAFIKVDPTGQSRRRDAEDEGPGFGGMKSPGRMPEGHFLGWQPGRQAAFAPAGLAWSLGPASDLVVEAHLSPTGKPERLEAEIGLHFTDTPPTGFSSRLLLTSYSFEIPPGANRFVVEDSFQLPVDVNLLAVLPHAHYLGREMQGWATRPDGSREELLLIRRWDFNWQGDYRYAQPVPLPRGTTLFMRFTYDNSTNNVRNPNHPPQPVRYGPDSRDEMAELWFQVTTRNAADRDTLQRAQEEKSRLLFIELYQSQLRRNPANVEALNNLALVRIGESRAEEALGLLRRAVTAQADSPRTHYLAALAHRQLGHPAEARAALETVLRLTPGDYKARGTLGFVLLELGDIAGARRQFEEAIALNPDDLLARRALEDLARRAPPALR